MVTMLYFLLVSGLTMIRLDYSLAFPDLKRQSTSKASVTKSGTKKKIKGALRSTSSPRRSDRRNRDRKDSRPVAGSSSSSSSQFCASSVESFLVARQVSIRVALSIFGLSAMLLALVMCARTCGVPRAQTIWQLLHDGTSAISSTMPSEYQPTPFDTHLATLILSSRANSNIMLPPALLPSAGPILSFIASALAYLCFVILMPQWSTAFRVFLDFDKADSLLSSAASSSTSSSPSCMPNIYALVRQDEISGRGGRTTSPNESNLPGRLLVCPLKESDASNTDGATERRRHVDGHGDGNADASPDDTEAIDSDYVHPTDYYFEVDQCRIYCDPYSNPTVCVDGGPTLQNAPLSAIQALVERGLSPQQRRIAQERYLPYNRLALSSPTVMDVFLRRISSPLVVIQILGRIMSCLEDGKEALLHMAVSIFQHYRNARQAIVSATQMAEEVKTNLQDATGCNVSVWKEESKEWMSMAAGDMIPGDIFRFRRGLQSSATGDKHMEIVVPVDALVLKGSCLANEAVLTGESVPQVKTPIDYEGEIAQTCSRGESRAVRRLDLHRDRASILFAGTTLLHTSATAVNVSEEVTELDRENYLTCLALRTGTYSSKGKLVNALRGNARTGKISNAYGDKDAIRLIAASAMFATIACLSLILCRQGSDVTVSPFRRVIQCTRIALASIPSDLPLALSSIARACSMKLRETSDVVCSDPGSLLTAAYVDTVVFDKTGTLTADTQSLAKLVTPVVNGTAYVSDSLQRLILAGCHSLVQLPGTAGGRNEAIGDPLDQASLTYSGWRYDKLSSSYYRPGADSSTCLPSEPVRLWQIRSFPFDPSRRLSSAIVLVQLKNQGFQLWKLTKGAPETMLGLLKKDTEDFHSKFADRTQELEMQGYRSIAMGALDISNATIYSSLFPNDFSAEPEDLIYARSQGSELHRNDIEVSALHNDSGLMFCGYCCFDASLRPSSKRVINELKSGGINTIILTGDSVDAAICVARKVNVISKQGTVAVLDTLTNAETGEESLVWKLTRSTIDKAGSFRMLRTYKRVETATISTSSKLMKRHKNGQLSFAANSRALELVLTEHQNDVHRLITRNLPRMAVIARATPELKKVVIDSLKHACGRQVMMCGDGINDVAAIQSADVAAALLNGFGVEDDSRDVDVDDERRRKILQSSRIGVSRANQANKPKKNHESKERIRQQIDKARKEIDERVARRQKNESSSDPAHYTLKDVKDIVSASLNAYRDEKHRANRLKKGGGDAARILAKERKMFTLTHDVNEETAGDIDADDTTIKPGEVSLVASFSFLHPSVDGVDAVLRQGIATAASVLATQQVILLNSVMSCYYLTTLYRDGFRYGNNMWHFEVFFNSLASEARFEAAFTPRPRLPQSMLCRPPRSFFDPVILFSTMSQAIIHVLCMSVGVSFAKCLERDGCSLSRQRDRIGLRTVRSLGIRNGKFEHARMALSQHTRVETENGKFRLFGRPHFQPNYETNVVFMFNVLQTAITALMDHKGKPFYRGILESRDLCLVSGATLLFFLVCVSGTIMPSVTTNILQLRPLPTKKSKLAILGVAAVNITACAICRWIADRRYDRPNDVAQETTNPEAANAAGYEEKLLEEEAAINAKKLMVCFGFLSYLLLDIITH